ncbi:MAG: type IV secretion system DotC family protein [Legionellales bacterium]
MPKFIPRNVLPCLLMILSVLLVVSCRSSRTNMGDTSSLTGLQSMTYTKTNKEQKKIKISKIREMALRETALSIGAQAGLAWRARFIDEELSKQSRSLDAIYDFNSLVLEQNILPPVLLEGRNTLNLGDGQSIRISDRTYKVAKQAHFITTPPNWRQYLWLDYLKPDRPDVSLLPKTKAEKQVWRTYTEKGWKGGIDQANTILEENIARVKEDFGGMILYRKLLAMNMVSPPYVSHTDLGVTGDASEMHIDDRVLRITALPGLNINSEEWKAAVAKDENALEQFKNMEKIASQAKIVITNRSWNPIITPVS